MKSGDVLIQRLKFCYKIIPILWTKFFGINLWVCPNDSWVLPLWIDQQRKCIPANKIQNKQSIWLQTFVYPLQTLLEDKLFWRTRHPARDIFTVHIEHYYFKLFFTIFEILQSILDAYTHPEENSYWNIFIWFRIIAFGEYKKIQLFRISVKPDWSQ